MNHFHQYTPSNHGRAARGGERRGAGRPGGRGGGRAHAGPERHEAGRGERFAAGEGRGGRCGALAPRPKRPQPSRQVVMTRSNDAQRRISVLVISPDIAMFAAVVPIFT